MPRRDSSAPPAGADEQALARYQQERAGLLAQRDSIDQRVTALDGVIAGLEKLLGKQASPPARRGRQATGTKALILDVCADGVKRRAHEIAAACRVQRTGGFITHLTELVDAGDLKRFGRSRSTKYAID